MITYFKSLHKFSGTVWDMPDKNRFVFKNEPARVQEGRHKPEQLDTQSGADMPHIFLSQFPHYISTIMPKYERGTRGLGC